MFSASVAPARRPVATLPDQVHVVEPGAHVADGRRHPGGDVLVVLDRLGPDARVTHAARGDGEGQAQRVLSGERAAVTEQSPGADGEARALDRGDERAKRDDLVRGAPGLRIVAVEAAVAHIGDRRGDDADLAAEEVGGADREQRLVVGEVEGRRLGLVGRLQLQDPRLGGPGHREQGCGHDQERGQRRPRCAQHPSPFVAKRAPPR